MSTNSRIQWREETWQKRLPEHVGQRSRERQIEQRLVRWILAYYRALWWSFRKLAWGVTLLVLSVALVSLPFLFAAFLVHLVLSIVR